MAEQVTDQHTPGFAAKEVNNSQQQSPNMDHVPESDAGDARNETKKLVEEPKNVSGEDKNQPPEQQIGKGTCENNQENESKVVQETSNPSNTDKNTEAENNNVEEEAQAVVKKPKNESGEDKNQPVVQNLTSSSLSPNEEAETVDEEGKRDENKNTEAENNNVEEEEQAETDDDEDKEEDKSKRSGLDIQENKTSSQTETPQILDNVETVGPTPQKTVDPPVPVDTRSPGGIGYMSVVVIIAAILGAVTFNHFNQLESPPQIENWRPTVQFLKEMDKLKTKFPNQRAELWNRSRIHLLRHLQTAHPTEPVSLILTAGVRAEKTLHCLARGFASAFSYALNASVLDIDGASKASQDSDEVKLDIDSKLQGAFEGNTPVAIIHRFEELPPGSTLIFYRYCDHENAAYKKTFLIFTVLLGEEKEIPAESHLSAVEEMVDDHLQYKFLSHNHPMSFDKMDLDKYGGLWSRISHLILPVTAEERIGHEGCEYNRT